MILTNNFRGAAGLVVGAAIVLGVVALWRRLPSAAAVGTAFNPASPDNLAYRGLAAAVQAMSGDTNQTPGGAIFDALNPQAGMGPGEYSPAPGIIASAPMVFPSAWDNEYLSGAVPTFAETPAGAVTGRIISK